MQTETEEIMRLLRSSILTKKKNLAAKAISTITILALLLLTI